MLSKYLEVHFFKSSINVQFIFFYRIDYKKKLFAVKEILKKVREWKKKFDFHQSMATKRADLEGMKKELACAEFQECREEIK